MAQITPSIDAGHSMLCPYKGIKQSPGPALKRTIKDKAFSPLMNAGASTESKKKSRRDAGGTREPWLEASGLRRDVALAPELLDLLQGASFGFWDQIVRKNPCTDGEHSV